MQPLKCQKIAPLHKERSSGLRVSPQSFLTLSTPSTPLMRITDGVGFELTRIRATDLRRLAVCSSRLAARCSESLARSHRSCAVFVLSDMIPPLGCA